MSAIEQCARPARGMSERGRDCGTAASLKLVPQSACPKSRPGGRIGSRPRGCCGRYFHSSLPAARSLRFAYRTRRVTTCCPRSRRPATLRPIAEHLVRASRHAVLTAGAGDDPPSHVHMMYRRRDIARWDPLVRLQARLPSAVRVLPAVRRSCAGAPSTPTRRRWRFWRDRGAWSRELPRISRRSSAECSSTQAPFSGRKRCCYLAVHYRSPSRTAAHCLDERGVTFR